MKMYSLKNLWLGALCTVLIGLGSRADAQTQVFVDPGDDWVGFMNVFEINRDTTPPTAGGFVFGSGWGFEDLTASFSGNQLTLGPNTIGDPDEFWYVGGGGPGALGNKWMDANGFVQRTNDAAFTGVEVTFSGSVLSNSLTANHTATAFIRDFAPDFSSFNEASVVLTTGDFSITLETVDAPGRHIQWGFNFAGENVWFTDVTPFGTVVIAAIPEPGIGMLSLCGVMGLILRRRR